jgi:hypothetical protein
MLQEKVVGFHYLGPNAGEVTQVPALFFVTVLLFDDFSLTSEPGGLDLSAVVMIQCQAIIDMFF